MTNPFARPNKFMAKPTVYNGRKYASKSEAAYAAKLDLLQLAGEVLWWIPQVRIMIGEPGVDKPYCVDFVVHYRGEPTACADEVKGVETAQFKRQKKQWAKRGPFPLRVIKGKKVEVIEPGGDAQGE